MKGAIAEPEVKTINTPNKRRMMIRGNNQNFLRVFKKLHKSLKNSI